MIRPQFPGEHVDALLRRLARETQRDGTLTLFHRAQHFTPNNAARRQKSYRAKKRQYCKPEKPHGYGGY